MWKGPERPGAEGCPSWTRTPPCVKRGSDYSRRQRGQPRLTSLLLWSEFVLADRFEIKKVWSRKKVSRHSAWTAPARRPPFVSCSVTRLERLVQLVAEGGR